MKKVFFILIVALFYSTPSIANTGWVDCEILEVTIESDNVGEGIVKFACQIPNPVSCTPHKNLMSFNPVTELGKAYHSQLLLAYASGKKVRAIGSGTCGNANLPEIISLILK